jgi:hypothetical protein
MTKAAAAQVPAATFDYTVLPPDIAEDLRNQTRRIRERVKSTTAAIIEIGRDLIAVKQQLDHGQFCEWVEAECGFTRRCAQRYMRAAEFVDAEFVEDKNDMLSLLQPATLYQISAKGADPEVVAEVIARAARGNVVPQVDVQRMWGEAKHHKDELERQEREKAMRQTRRSRKEKLADSRETIRKNHEEERASAKAIVLHIMEQFGAECATYLPTHLTTDVFFAVMQQLKEMGNLDVQGGDRAAAAAARPGIVERLGEEMAVAA